MSEPQPQLEIPTRAPAATSADDTILPFQVEALDLRGRVVRFGPAIDDHPVAARLSRPRGQAPGRGHRADRAARLDAEIRRPLHPADPERRAGADAGRRFHDARASVRACARFDAARVAAAMAAGAADPGALLGHGHLAMTIDQGPDTSALPGHRRARRQGPRARGARIFPALRTDPDPRAARGGRGAAGGGATAPATAGAPAACCCSSCRNRRSARASPTSIPATCRRAMEIPAAARGRRLGRRPLAGRRPSRISN